MLQKSVPTSDKRGVLDSTRGGQDQKMTDKPRVIDPMKTQLLLALLAALLSACMSAPKDSAAVQAHVVAHQTSLGLAATAQQQTNFWR
jgi:hypothetical protein